MLFFTIFIFLLVESSQSEVLNERGPIFFPLLKNVLQNTCAQCENGLALGVFCSLCKLNYDPVSSIDCNDCSIGVKTTFENFSFEPHICTKILPSLCSSEDVWIRMAGAVSGTVVVKGKIFLKGPFLPGAGSSKSLLNGGIPVPKLGYRLPDILGAKAEIGLVLDLIFEIQIAGNLEGNLTIPFETVIDWSFNFEFDSRNTIPVFQPIFKKSDTKLSIKKNFVSSSFNLTASLLPELRFSFPTLTFPGEIPFSLLSTNLRVGPSIILMTNASATHFKSTSPQNSWKTGSLFEPSFEICQNFHWIRYEVLTRGSLIGLFEPLKIPLSPSSIFSLVAGFPLRNVLFLFQNVFSSIPIVNLDLFQTSLVSGCLVPYQKERSLRMTVPQFFFHSSEETFRAFLTQGVLKNAKTSPPRISFQNAPGTDVQVNMEFPSSPLVVNHLINLICFEKLLVQNISLCKSEFKMAPKIDPNSRFVKLYLEFSDAVDPISLTSSLNSVMNSSCHVEQVFSSNDLKQNFVEISCTTAGLEALNIVSVGLQDPWFFSSQNETIKVLDIRRVVDTQKSAERIAIVVIPIFLVVLLVSVVTIGFVYIKRRSMKNVAHLAQNPAYIAD